MPYPERMFHPWVGLRIFNDEDNKHADNWGVEAIPGEDPNRRGEGHQWLKNRNGVYNLRTLILVR